MICDVCDCQFGEGWCSSCASEANAISSDKEDKAINHDYSHYFDGPCDGMSLHRRGRTVTLKDTSGREDEETGTYVSEEEARRALWRERDRLYAKWEPVR